jgi:hypothetical protein
MASTSIRSADGVLRVLSLGAGVQSSTCLLMSLAGELPRLDAAVFADTGWEPKAVYAHLDRLEATATAGGIRVYRVSAGNLRRDALDPTHHFASLPLYVRRPDGKRGMIRRQCTREYKLTPIRRKLRAMWEQAGHPPVEQWLGISADEVHRMRDSDVRYIRLRYVLVERGLTRADCQRWLAEHGWSGVPRSSCVGCPYHSDRQWRELRQRSPKEWADAVAFDRAIRHGHPAAIHKAALRGNAFLHPSLRPLDQVDLFPSDADAAEADGFGNDCQGVCGV